MPVLSPLAEPAALQEALVLQGKAVVRQAWSHGGSYTCQQPLLSWWHHACERTVSVEGTQAGVTNRVADVHSALYPRAGDRVARPLTASESRTRPGSIPEGLASPSGVLHSNPRPFQAGVPGGVGAEAPALG